jgi:DinB family protein
LRVTLIVRLMDQAYDHKAWHGPTLRGSLRGVRAPTAAWRPGTDRHNIWELAVHAAYWKYTVMRRVTGAPKGSFPLAGSDWFERPEELSEAAWKRDLQLLEDTHQQLRRAVLTVSDDDLDQIPAGSKTVLVDLLLGIASHDLYHAGQIQLIKRLQKVTK